MSFPRYPKYKESGVEWLGQVPEHWDIPKIKSIATFCGGGTPSRDNPSYWNGDIPWVSPKDMKSEQISTTEEAITEEGLNSSASSTLPEGCVLMVVRSGILKHTIPVGINHRPVALNQDMKALQFDPELCRPDFFFRWVQGLNDSLLLAWSKQGATVESIEHAYMANSLLPLPPLSEQSTIADFLDQETAKIDELIAEQERLIELLKEKRQAVISDSVTKGLNPDAPMKDSGIEWIGQVPEHWEVRPVKYLAKVGNGSTPSREVPEYWSESGFPWLNSSVVNLPEVTEAEGFVTERALQECHLPIVVPPAVLVGITGQGRTRGMASMLRIEATLNQHLAYVTPSSKQMDVKFLLRVFEMAYLKLRRDSEEAGATKGAITCEQIGNLRIPLPPITDQRSIVIFLDDETAKLDTLTTEAQRAITLLQERRSALISAAVTGQIDVRGIQNKEAA
jgi:type I restriction enzyme S subunit